VFGDLSLEVHWLEVKQRSCQVSPPMTDDPEESRRAREVNERASFLRVLICGRRGGSLACVRPTARGQRGSDGTT